MSEIPTYWGQCQILKLKFAKTQIRIIQNVK